MLFHVKMTVALPPDTDPERAAQLQADEHERAQELQRTGKWLHLWRIAGSWANISVFAVADPDELHTILSSLPLYPYMDVDVTALSRHPGAIAVTD
jgi:muconolactone D-isomerase